MAKNDLVVKLLLDSGAFGDDLRQAERRAKEFGDKMKSAGDTAGKFTSEIGLSAGAFSKLGGILTGAGGIIAAIGAFKSVMMSSHDSAKKFQGVIGGFSGVLDSLQYSFSTFDFTNFNKGLAQVYENAKQAKQAIMDAQLSTIAYDVIDKDTRLKLKQYEKEYKDPKTTPERREELTQLRDDLLNRASETAAQHAENLYESILKQLIGKNANIGDLEGDIEKTKQLIPFEELRRIMLDASMDIIFDADEALKDKWKEIQSQMTKLDNSADDSGATSEAYMLYAPPKWLEFLPWVKKSREKWKEFQGQSDADAKKARAEWEKLVMEYQELMIKNVLFTIGEEPLAKLTSDMEKALATQTAVEDLILQGMGWSVSSTGGSSTGGNKKKKDENIPNIESISAMDALIDWKDKELEGMTPDSAEWWEALDVLDSYNDELERLKKLKNELLGITPAEEVVPNIESISAMKALISWKEAERDTFAVGSSEWEEAIIVLDSYNAELERLLKIQEEFESQFEDKTSPVSNLSKNFEHFNTVLGSTAFLFESLGNVIEATGDKSSQNAVEMMHIFSAIAEGAVNVIPALQALTAAEGASEAAKTPWPANIAAIISIVATVASVFASIKQIKNNKFAEGGIVGGTSYSGDKLFAMVNSGEMILNKRQQRNLGNMLGGGGGQVEFHISGDSLVGVLNNRQNKRNLTR